MTINNRIEGLFHLTRPLHCASPDDSLKSPDKDNETPTMQMRVVTAQGLQPIPYFPGNDLRGRLRRKAATLVLDHLTTGDRKIKMELYAGLNCGAISASPESGLTVEEALRARDNVYMGLFGGGTRLLSSRYRVADLVPVIAETIELGMVPGRYAESDAGLRNFLPVQHTDGGPRAVGGWQLIQKTQIFRVDDVLRVLRPDELARYLDGTDEVVAYQAAVAEGSAQRKAEKAKAKAGEMKKTDVSTSKSVGNIAVFQSILAGTPMYFLLDFLDDATDAHVGLMLLALQELVREQALGGWTRAGLGKFKADLTLVRHGESMPIFAPDANEANAALSPALDQFVGQAREALAQITVDEMMAFFIPRALPVEEEA